MSDWVLLVSFSSLWLFCGVVVAQSVIPTGPQIVSKPLEWFKVRSNSRKRFDEESLHALGKDLRKRQISPVVCLPDGTVICGERRLRAAKLEGLLSLNVMIVTDVVTEVECRRLQLCENLQRQDLSNAEKAEGCVDFARSNPGMTLKEIAIDHLHVDPGLVTRWMSWERAIEAAREALAADKVTLNQFYDIAKLPPEQQMADLEAALNGKKPKGNGHSGTQRSRNKLLLPSGIEFTVAASDLSLDGLRSAIRDLQRLADEAKDVETLCEAMKVANSEGASMDVLAKALKAAKEAEVEVDLRTLMTVAKKKGKARKG